jgi:gluconate:H+ symporter, GntP family
VGDAIKELFGGSSVTGMAMLFLGFGIASLLKVAQGSSTSAMIITSGMMVGMLVGVDLPFNRVYLATAIGAGSLVGSWMNDSGFWIFCKMGGLTEKEALSTWTPLLIVLGLVSMGMTLLLANVLPMAT